jgi:trk system potassium uptake protein
MKKIKGTPLRVSGSALVAISFGMFASSGVALADGGGGALGLLVSAFLTLLIGAIMFGSSSVSDRADTPVALASVAWSWLAVSIAGAIPFLMTGSIAWAHFDDALFESVSGFTCTGSTILSDIEAVPRGVLFFRSMMQWFGGMGLIVLAVAVLPALKIGGLELIANEAPGPTADRLTPKVTDTARRLWLLYGGITFAMIAALMVVGLSPYDAASHAFTTVATGGFSPYNASIAHFDSLLAEFVIIVGMMFCGANFSLHWYAFNRGLKAYHRVSELRWYLGLIIGSTFILMWLNFGNLSLGRNIRESFFYAVSLGTSTGFGTSDFTVWAPAAQIVLLTLMIVGGMTGSTAGGMKILRLQILVRYSFREIIRARHPKAVVPIRMGAVSIDEQIAAKAVGFILLYMGLIVFGGLTLAGLGVEPVTAFSGAVSAIGNAGPGLGDAGPVSNFLVFPRLGRVILMFLMMFGRLEVFPVMLMFVAFSRAVSRSRYKVRQ